MEQSAATRFFALKGFKAKAIQAKPESVYGRDACKLCTLKKWRLPFLQRRTTLFDDPRSGSPLTSDLAEPVLSMLAKQLFTSCKVVCRHLRIARTTRASILHDEFGLQKFHVRWVPHALSSNQQHARITYSSLLLEVLETTQRTGFQRIITGHESWFSLYSSHDSVWTTSRDELPERVTQRIDTEKCLISIPWFLDGIHSLIDVPKGNTSNTTFFCNQVVPSLIHGITSHSRRTAVQGFMIHLDNGSPHNSRKSQQLLEPNQATRVKHLAHSPNRAPNDFFPSVYVKENSPITIAGAGSREHLKSAITSIFDEIGQKS
jgi:hypothetical protein